ncbi:MULTISPECIES: pitrilysin family protein [Oceanobacillus]|uniref:Peptidase M16 n=1 Tax=Oceanobacillus kimchii TaxID=746691 RepID=A0ABQ5TKA0_9BACI|nr:MULTISPECIES: pitrilysin family protein [Oceanobacillus]MBT2598661.1 insulinase family protein [Oceanobacillus sp. ISL-74]MBT2651580.1 insulinase family protein [Oceanobacillus sp. ISL-73]MCT1576229.1 insulinase family protein [Oceanobacillus kimchii]MCT2135866.1 insulinase family protein [Oceanobacillus kimchii]OEH54708.1 zinc protease [Oceanobacillus sp. E9]
MIERHTCNNGLRIVHEQIPAVRSVTIGIWILTGSRNESNQNNGISHFLEHMFFKGTATRSAQDIAEEFDSIGGQINAFTSKEYTCFYAKVLDTHKEYALEILADMFFNSTFDPEEMEREKKVVLEEIKMYEDTPDDIVHDLLAKASYGTHPLGYPILGTEDQLLSFDSAQLKDYIEHAYSPERVVISVAGNVDASFMKTIDSSFGSYTGKSNLVEIIKPTFLAESIDRHKDTEQAHLCLGYQGLEQGHPLLYSLTIMNNVLGGSMSSRLFQDVREKQGLAYAVFSYHSTFIDSGLLTIYGGTGKEQLSVLEDTIQLTVNTLIQNGLTDKELRNSKEQLKGGLMLSLESTNSRMSRNGRNELLLKRHRTLDEMIQEIDAVSHDTIQQVINEVFKEKAARALIAPKAN